MNGRRHSHGGTDDLRIERWTQTYWARLNRACVKYSAARANRTSFRLLGMAKNWKTKLIHSDVKVPEGFRSLSVGVQRASTVLFPDAASVRDDWDPYEVGYTYGLYGTSTTLALAARVCELEGGFRTLITPGGQCAISLINLAFLKVGDHVLDPRECVYTESQVCRGGSAQVRRGSGVLRSRSRREDPDIISREHADGVGRESGIDHARSAGCAVNRSGGSSCRRDDRGG